LLAQPCMGAQALGNGFGTQFRLEPGIRSHAPPCPQPAGPALIAVKRAGTSGQPHSAGAGGMTRLPR
jgi:hypothetical protein